MASTSSSILPPKTFYMRPLPSPPCTALSSPQGRIMFQEALQEGTMESFFQLSDHFVTQDEPAFCGVSTLAMVLNALAIDPGRVWKGAWRWYHESMLDCCKPLDEVKKDGITLEQFACLARCNGAAIAAYSPETHASTSACTSIDEVRNLVKTVVSDAQHNAVLVASYDRRGLKQTGSGHFSPVGGYHAASDSVFIFDVARFKYPSHWVPLSVLWESMKTPDPSTNLPRGFLSINRSPAWGGLVHGSCCPSIPAAVCEDDVIDKRALSDSIGNGSAEKVVSCGSSETTCVPKAVEFHDWPRVIEWAENILGNIDNMYTWDELAENMTVTMPSQLTDAATTIACRCNERGGSCKPLVTEISKLELFGATQTHSVELFGEIEPVRTQEISCCCGCTGSHMLTLFMLALLEVASTSNAETEPESKSDHGRVPILKQYLNVRSGLSPALLAELKHLTSVLEGGMGLVKLRNMNTKA